MTKQRIIVTEDPHGVCVITLNRPDIHNAFDDILITELTETLNTINKDPNIRLVILKANGKSFCAGADLNWMQRMVHYSEAENFTDSLKLAHMLQLLNTLQKPTIACIQGNVFGGGLGLIACCDIALATPEAQFCLSEVRIGLIPAVISPYLISAIGTRHARRYFLSAEVFSAETALAIGLINEVIANNEIATRIETLIVQILQNSSEAVMHAKQLIHDYAFQQIDGPLIEDSAQRIAKQRVSAQGQEGLTAFLQKRKPQWNNNDV